MGKVIHRIRVDWAIVLRIYRYIGIGYSVNLQISNIGQSIPRATDWVVVWRYFGIWAKIQAVEMDKL
jgi:hypothetical protein